jgi:EAL domain-containing protein (putative c-di-GMP-specific phosphodiesterase class I)/GGDEF domain-containing protein
MGIRDARKTILIRIRKLEDNAGDFLLVLTNITDMLDRDPLTDLFSRTGFLNHAQHLINQIDLDEGYSLVYTNIRGFKTINELFGELAGDAVIFECQQAIEETLNPLVMGRLENDHFVCICKDSVINPIRMKKLCHRILMHDNSKYEYDMTCGIYRIKRDGTSPGIMLDRAKMAEKSVLENNQFQYASYTDEMMHSYVSQQVLVGDLRNALDTGEIIPYFQPVVDAGTGKVVSAECLVRWNHHDLGMVSPGLFIPALENSGKVAMVDFCMLQKVVAFQEEQMNSGQAFVPVSVNLSRMDFYDTEVIQNVLLALEQCRVPLEYIKFEITESAYAQLERSAKVMLDDLRNLNIKIMLDDYGSGMSSLSTLEGYDFDTVKLDMGFIRKIGKSSKAEAIIRSTISLAHELNEDIIAEGVETQNQVDFLRKAGCDMIQGYYFYKPLPAEAYRKILLQH